MPLQSAITALSPLVYLPLNTGDASGLLDVSGHGHNGTASGDYDLTAVGPEHGTFGARMFAGSSILSGALGFSGASDLSLMAMVALRQESPTNTLLELMRWGDAANPGLRGLRMYGQTSSTNVISVGGFWTNPATAALNVFAQSTWHLVTVTYANATRTIIGYADTLSSSVVQSSVINALSTADQLIVPSNTPIVISHIAAWPRVLTPTEITGVAGLVAQWPFEVPINTQPTASGGTTDLTPVLTDTGAILSNQGTFMPQITDMDTIVPQIHTQTTTMETNWSNYTSVTLPSLNDELGLILNGLTSTISGVGGAISKTIGELFTGPSFDQLSPEDLGTACAPDVIDVTLGVSIRYGLQMQCTSHADWYVFTGSDDAYSTQSLGALEVFRGGNLVLRQGLHTLTHTIYPLPGVPVLPINVGVELVPAEYQVVLTPAPETCWHLEALVQP